MKQSSVYVAVRSDPRLARAREMGAFLAQASPRVLAGFFARRRALLDTARQHPQYVAAQAVSARSVRDALVNLASPSFSVARAVGVMRVVDPQALTRKLNLSAAALEEALAQLSALGLIVDGKPVVGLAELFDQATIEPPTTPPDHDELPIRQGAVGYEAAHASEEAVRLTAELLAIWEAQEAPMLRQGGVGVRALRATASALGVAPDIAALVAENAVSAGLLGLSEYGTGWIPSSFASVWRQESTAEQWADLVLAWLSNPRIPWTDERTDEGGRAVPILAGQDVEPYLMHERAQVLASLAQLPQGAAPDAHWVSRDMRYRAPLLNSGEAEIEVFLGQLAFLGLSESGALTPVGRIVAETAMDAVRGRHLDLLQVRSGLVGELDTWLGQYVDALMVQSDLTAVVPGRPTPELEALLSLTSRVESRQSALTVRFSAQSLRPAFDEGMSAAELTQALAGFSLTPLPSALTTLISDAARRYGLVRVRPAGAVLRVEDPAAAVELIRDKRLKVLELSEVAPGVVVSTQGADRVLRALRDAGMSPVVEDGAGTVMTVKQWMSAGGTQADSASQVEPQLLLDGAYGRLPDMSDEEQDLYEAWPQLRSLLSMSAHYRGARPERASSIMKETQSIARVSVSQRDGDPREVLDALHAAQRSRASVTLSVADNSGKVVSRTVTVMRVDAGRVRVVDTERGTEMTVALHRITGVDGVS